LTGRRVRGRLRGTVAEGEQPEAKGKNKQPMRLLKTLYLVALFSLSMGLFCGELPETLNLRDDTSNDYVNDSNATAAEETALVQKETFSEQRETSGQHQVIAASPTPSAGPAILSGQELLQQFSIRRT
jgi:hypothetical protein